LRRAILTKPEEKIHKKGFNRKKETISEGPLINDRIAGFLEAAKPATPVIAKLPAR
jgi:hypothetical protein